MTHSYSQSHPDIQRILDAALDHPLDAETQAALDQHLAACAECRSYAASLKKLEARLGPALGSRWPAAALTDGQRASFLENILSHTRRTPMKTHISSSMRLLALGALAILLIVALGWGIRNLKPTSPAGGGEGRTPTASTVPEGQTPSATTPSTLTGETLSTPTFTPTMQTIILTPPPTATQAPVLTPTPAPSPVGSVSVFPQVQFVFATDFPDAPGQVTLYQQQFSEPITVDLARQAAAALGVSGEVTQYTGEGGGTIYEVRGGGSVVRFLGYADQFVFEVLPNADFKDPAGLPPFDRQVSIAEAFLRQKGLLEGAYRVEPVVGDPGVVRFGQLLDDRQVRYGVGDGRAASPLQWIDVSVTVDGEVNTVSYYDHRFQSVGQYPILPAQQAWERFSAKASSGYGMFAILSAEKPVTYRSWTQDFAVGPVHMYNYAIIVQSAEGGTPVTEFGRYPLTGAADGMETGKFLHAWGQIILDEKGNKNFKVEGWEVSPLADSNLSGTIQRSGDSATLQTDDGRWLSVTGLPADVPEEVQVDIRGVVLNDALEWSFIQTGEYPNYYSSMLSCGGGGGGGNETPDADFGGGSLANLELAGLTPPPTQSASTYPYQAGDTLEGQIGNVWVTINQYADHAEIDAAMWVEGSDGVTYVAHLSGAGLNGIENYNSLPIKVWGRVDQVSNGEMYFTVDRFEEAYPGLRIQAWIGTEQAVTLEDKTVLLFTTLDGQQFILKASIGYGDQVRIGQAGFTVIREGLLIPGETFGNYPVVQDLAGMVANGRTDLSGYTIISGQPSVFDHTLEVPVVSPASIVQGTVTIDKIELVYLAYSLAGCPVDTFELSAMTFVQPAWRFTGTFEDGRRFEVLVQALTESNLMFAMPGG